MTKSMLNVEFGYYPRELSLKIGPIEIQTLPEIDQTVSKIEKCDSIVNDWIYPPLRSVHNIMSGMQTTRPYPARVFGLPKTHIFCHATARSEDQLTFHIWTLSFFVGLRLTATEAGYLDATPIRPHKLVDFVLSANRLNEAIKISEAFWVANAKNSDRARRFEAAVHALFISQNPQLLQFEEFIFLYTALDACFALAESLRCPRRRHVRHSERIKWMCDQFQMATPPWADPSATDGAEIAAIRNSTLHEALFMDRPLGFAVHGVGTNQNLMLEMRALVCRLLIAMLGAEKCDYVRTPINTRQYLSLDLI